MQQPTIEQRVDQPYMGTRAVISMSDFAAKVPAMRSKVLEWLDGHDLKPAGKPFLRYHVIAMPDRMDVELGVPVNNTQGASNGVRGESLPSGRYAVTTYVGVKNGIDANKELIDWIAKRGEATDSSDSATGETFGARYETYRTDPATQPDQDKWEIEIAIRLRESTL